MSRVTRSASSAPAARRPCSGSTSSTSGMNLSAEVEIEIPFFDVDPMAVAWHGHYVKYFEVARCAMLRKIDYDYPKMQASGYLFPVVELYLKYVNAARYGQMVVVAAEVLEYENRLKIGYRSEERRVG